LHVPLCSLGFELYDALQLLLYLLTMGVVVRLILSIKLSYRSPTISPVLSTTLRIACCCAIRPSRER
jgi:hypothetical protein